MSPEAPPNQWYEDWIKNNLPDQSGKVAIVTGANSGTGFWCAHALAGAGATVVLACRNQVKAEQAKKDILKDIPQAKLDIIELDTSKLNVVRAFAKSFLARYDRLDILANNAGIMAMPYSNTEDGFEIQFQTNHLGHFLLTKLLWDVMIVTPGQSRIVQHSSSAHYLGSGKFSKDHMEKPQYGWSGVFVVLIMQLMGYPKWNWLRYCVSKLCNVLFMKELQSKIEAEHLEKKIISVACHPGGAYTSLQVKAGEAGSMPGWENHIGMMQSAADGSLPLLMACAGKGVSNGDYYGPTLKSNFQGPPGSNPTKGFSNDKSQAKSLWQYSEECVGEEFRV